MTMSNASAALPVSGHGGTPRIQDLAAALRSGADTDEVLELLTRSAGIGLGVRNSALVMPLGTGTWSIEIADGPDADALLGLDIDPDSPLGQGLAAGDASLIERAGECAGEPALLAALSTPEGPGALAVLPVPAKDAAAARERLDALAGLIGLALLAPTPGASTEIADERSRIARDLHDLAIQELFAVGMELESLTAALNSPGDPPSNARIRASVATSVQGVENAVAQIRHIVQSLRRERVEATLTERLRHEVGLATAGLGFAPALRLPPQPERLDREIPEEIAEDIVAVVRECLANAARHAHASAVAVSVSQFSEGVDRVVQVNVSDNGRGIDPSVTRRSGLANMSSRARRHSGWVDALSLEPGTMISWRVTLPPA